jgi:hypothetical protein
VENLEEKIKPQINLKVKKENPFMVVVINHLENTRIVFFCIRKRQ